MKKNKLFLRIFTLLIILIVSILFWNLYLKKTPEIKLKNIELIEDLGSGLNFKKKGLKKLIKLIISSKIDKIILTHKDRLLRFGSDLLNHSLF